MTICDAYDALRSKRPCQIQFDHLKTVDIITRSDGRTQPEQFDPDVLGAFTQYHQSFCDIFKEYTA